MFGCLIATLILWPKQIHYTFMKKINFLSIIYFLLVFISSIAFSANATTGSGGYEIKVHINGLKDTVCYLGNHFGEKQYVKDTLVLVLMVFF